MIRNNTAISFAFCFLAIALFNGCGPEEHAPQIGCINIGIENVRRYVRIRVSIGVDRPPLSGVSSETVHLLKLPEESVVEGDIYYSGERICFTLSQPLGDSTEYRFEIEEGISDASGQEMSTLRYEFWTGNILQIYAIDLLRDYNTSTDEINSIAIYFSEGVDAERLEWGSGNITVYENDWLDQIYDVTYYDEVALAVLLFNSPLQIDTDYKLTVGGDIISDSDVGWLDGDRDGTESDRDPFVIRFEYRHDPVYGIEVADSTCEAQPYYEPIERCFLYEFD